MKKVLVESPFGSDDDEIVKRNIRYLRQCLHDCFINYNEAPFASHGLYTLDGVLDDRIKEQRSMGIEAGLIWGKEADYTVVYTDFGITKGMRLGIERARKENRKVYFRKLKR